MVSLNDVTSLKRVFIFVLFYIIRILGFVDSQWAKIDISGRDIASTEGPILYRDLMINHHRYVFY
jgi:hypothetical protein